MLFWGRELLRSERGDVQETMLNARVCQGFCFSRAERVMQKQRRAQFLEPKNVAPKRDAFFDGFGLRFGVEIG